MFTRLAGFGSGAILGLASGYMGLQLSSLIRHQRYLDESQDAMESEGIKTALASGLGLSAIITLFDRSVFSTAAKAGVATAAIFQGLILATRLSSSDAIHLYLAILLSNFNGLLVTISENRVIPSACSLIGCISSYLVFKCNATWRTCILVCGTLGGVGYFAVINQIVKNKTNSSLSFAKSIFVRQS